MTRYPSTSDDVPDRDEGMVCGTSYSFTYLLMVVFIVIVVAVLYDQFCIVPVNDNVLIDNAHLTSEDSIVTPSFIYLLKDNLEILHIP